MTEILPYVAPAILLTGTIIGFIRWMSARIEVLWIKIQGRMDTGDETVMSALRRIEEHVQTTNGRVTQLEITAARLEGVLLGQGGNQRTD